ncbi:TonB-dependent receptor [Chitinophaga sp. sic0106]|uniref:TonB-dependent receptor n=1 Tax=Chitinophaga sp. sic0106 TaxID=2854785 RepID=UPI001C44AA38|nr:TonB-dependent receptor [Chitinophaga sp. sic0106]MBV7532389.1 TonB-dependent receptor [Chitinophaga sp. sic0106]
MSLTGKLLTVLFFLSLPLQVLGWDWQTKVTVVVQHQSLQTVCELLEKNYNIHFSYSRDLVNLSRKVTVTVHNQRLKTVLEDLFAPDDIKFTRVGDLLVLLPNNKTTRTINGYVKDAATGERLPGATIWSPTLQQGTVTNQYGFFSFTTTKDTSSVVVSFIGYQPQWRQFPKNDRTIEISLESTTLLKEVVVNGGEGNNLQNQTQMSKVNISSAAVNKTPRLLGDADLIRTLQAIPGVSGGMDGVSGLHVRGGSPDQNLILLDGSPIFNFSHFFGIFSLINPDVVKSTDLYKGAFPARFGGRLSSVVDITLKDGDMNSFHGDAAIGLISTKFDLEGPIVKDKTSFIVSARRSYPDLVYNSLIRLEDDEKNEADLSAYFYDINAKLNHIFSPKDRLYLSFYTGEDKMSLHLDSTSIPDTAKINMLSSGFDVSWGNTIGALRWNHIYGPKLFSNISLNYSTYAFSTQIGYKYTLPAANELIDQVGSYRSRMEIAGVRADFDYRPAPSHGLRFGTAVNIHDFKPSMSTFADKSGSVTPLDTVANGPQNTAAEMLLYIEDDWQLSPVFFVNAGLHASGFLVSGKLYHSLQPRLGLRYMLPKNWALKAAYTQMNQYIHLLSNYGTSLPTDIWVPATDRVAPMSSRQMALGIAKTSNRQVYEFTVEGYYKNMHNMIELRDPMGFITPDLLRWEDQVSVGRGWSYGGEVMIAKKKGTTTGWIGYTLSWSTRKFADINNGKIFPYKYDHRHDVEVVFNQVLAKNWDFSASWRFSTGSPLTLPVASYEGIETGSPWDPVTGPGNSIDRYGNRYNYRTENSHRLDIGINWTKQRAKWSRTWNFSVINVYNHKNPFYYYVKRDDEAKQRYLSKVVILPILPSVTYSVKF